MSLLNKSLIAPSLALLLSTSLYANENYTVNTTSLNEAIKQISKTSKLPFVVDADILEGKKAKPIKNVESLEEALKAVLKDTDLEAVISNGTIVIRKKEGNLSTSNIDEKLESVLIVGSQDSYYDQYSSTSMKGEFDDKESPYSTAVTNKTLINDIQALRLEDTFDYTTGVSKAGKGADSFTIRGFDVDLQNIQVNGMPGLINRFDSPSTRNIEKIEVVKGPASVLYGNMEAGGFLNIQTKLPQAENKITLETTYETYASSNSSFGSDSGYTLALDATGEVKKDLYYRFIAVKEDLNSFRDDVEFDNIYIYPSLLWNISEQTSLLLAMEYGKEEGSADNGLAAINNDINKIASINTVYQEKNDFDNDEGTAIDINLQHNFLNDSVLNVSLRSVFHEDERKLFESNKVDDSTQTLIRRNRHQFNERDWHSLDTNYQFSAKTSNIVHNMTAGLAANYRKTDFDRKVFDKNLSPNISIYNPVHGGTAGTDEGNRRKTEYKSTAVYFQDKMDIGEDFVFVASARADRTKVEFDCLRDEGASCKDNSDSSNNFVGSLGLVYKLNSLVSLYSSIGQSYDPITVEKVDKSGEGLDSEESKQIEFGAKFNIDEQFSATTSIYKINKENVSEKVSGTTYYELAGEIESKGFEADIQWLPTKNWQIKTGYSYNKAEYVEGENKDLKPSNTPKRTAFVFTRYNIPTKIYDGILGLSTGLSYRDKIYTSSSESKRVELPSYTRWDMGVYYDKKDWSLSLNVENLTDKEYFESGKDDYRIYAAEPRKITFNFKKSF